MLFADLRGFTALCDQLDPALTVHPERLLRAHEPGDSGHHGTSPNSLAMACWRCSARWNPNPWQGRDAVLAALGYARSAGGLQLQLRGQALPELRFGIGIHSGEVSVGVMGAGELSKFSVTGDPINVASRVEGLTREHGVDLLITEESVAPSDGFRLRPMPPSPSKAKSRRSRRTTSRGSNRRRRGSAIGVSQPRGSNRSSFDRLHLMCSRRIDAKHFGIVSSPAINLAMPSPPSTGVEQLRVGREIQALRHLPSANIPIHRMYSSRVVSANDRLSISGSAQPLHSEDLIRQLPKEQGDEQVDRRASRKRILRDDPADAVLLRRGAHRCTDPLVDGRRAAEYRCRRPHPLQSLALVLRKSVLLADMLPMINRFPQRPLIYNVAWKTLIYLIVAGVIHYIEHLVDYVRASGSV